MPFSNNDNKTEPIIKVCVYSACRCCNYSRDSRIWRNWGEDLHLFERQEMMLVALVRKRTRPESFQIADTHHRSTTTPPARLGIPTLMATGSCCVVATKSRRRRSDYCLVVLDHYNRHLFVGCCGRSVMRPAEIGTHARRRKKAMPVSGIVGLWTLDAAIASSVGSSRVQGALNRPRCRTAAIQYPAHPLGSPWQAKCDIVPITPKESPCLLATPPRSGPRAGSI
jgi:hypothetical protein